MAKTTFKVMTREDGDKPTTFNTASATGLEEANARFAELTGKGFLAYVPNETKRGESKQIRSFDPEAKEIIFTPQRKGG